jgi:hypothetical protein
MLRQAIESPRSFLTNKREQRHSNLSRYISKDPKRDTKLESKSFRSSILETSARDLSKSISNALQELKATKKVAEKREASRGRSKVDCWRPKATHKHQKSEKKAGELDIEIIPVVTTVLLPQPPPHDKILTQMRTVMDSVGKAGASKAELERELELCFTRMRLEFEALCRRKIVV